jgi:hypothetical protein
MEVNAEFVSFLIKNAEIQLDDQVLTEKFKVYQDLKKQEARDKKKIYNQVHYQKHREKIVKYYKDKRHASKGEVADPSR